MLERYIYLITIYPQELVAYQVVYGGCAQGARNGVILAQVRREARLFERNNWQALMWFRQDYFILK